MNYLLKEKKIEIKEPFIYYSLYFPLLFSGSQIISFKEAEKKFLTPQE